MKKSKNIIILAILLAISVMAVGYATFATQMTLNGTAEIAGIWGVKIIGIEMQEKSIGCDEGVPEYTDTNVKFHAKLNKPGDIILYEVTIKNEGTIDAKLSSATFTADDENGSPAIKFTTTDPDVDLPAGEETTFDVAIVYDQTVKEVPSIKTKTITGNISYVQK